MHYPNSEQKSQLVALTGLRFLAAIWVVLLHNTNPAKVPAFARNFINRGYVAVDVFFILSGFILTLNYLTPNGALRGTKIQFWMARIARIYPVYALALLLVIPMGIELLRSGGFFTGRLQFGVSFLMTALLQQGWWSSAATLWNFPAWSVSVEAFFYLIFPLALAYIVRIPARRLYVAIAICWSVAMAGPLIGFIDNPAASYDAFRTDFGRYVLMVNPLLRAPEFIFGMLVGRVYQTRKPDPRALSRWTLAALAAAAAVLFTAGTPRIFISNGLLAPAWGLLILALSFGKPAPLYRFLSVPLIVVLGEASYGIYILQAPIAWFVFHGYHGPARLTVYVVTLLTTSLLSFWYFETPVRNRIRVSFGKKPVDLVAPADALNAPLTRPAEPGLAS